MISLPAGSRIWLVAGITDMRNGFNGLASKVQNVLKDDPFSGHLFIFRRRWGDQIKVLWADSDGLCLFTKLRSYLPDALRLRFEDKLTIRAIAQRLGLSHSTIHTLFQRFIASGIAWPLPDSVSLVQLDAILYANRKKELTEPQISEGTWRKERRASYSREFKVRLAKQALQPGAVVARIAREHGINDNLLFKWKSQYEDGLLSDDEIQECMPVPVALTDTPEPTRPVTNPFWRNKPDECPESDPGNVPRCELHLKSGVVKLFDPLTPEMLRALIREMKGGTR